MDKPLTQQLREAAEWCAGEQTHTVYSDAAYVGLFRQAAAVIERLQKLTPSALEH